jgi:hypothetical protein
MAFTFKLEHPEGTPADPPTLRSAVPNWEIGDKIPFGPSKPALLVVGVRNASEPTHQSASCRDGCGLGSTTGVPSVVGSHAGAGPRLAGIGEIGGFTRRVKALGHILRG